jgi:hypothetical protein
MSTASVERVVAPLSTIREVKSGSFIFERPQALPGVKYIATTWVVIA